MRVFLTSDTKEHMCDSCTLNVPECSPYIIDFGNGFGNDNVIKCSAYTGKCSETITITNEIVTKG